MGGSKQTVNRISHYIPPATYSFSDLEKEFVQPCSDDSFIWWLFRYRCVDCRQAGTEINEIVPRGRTKKALVWTNRVVMCRNCHQAYHLHGVTNEKIKALREKRTSYLMSIGRGEYIGSR